MFSVFTHSLCIQSYIFKRNNDRNTSVIDIELIIYEFIEFIEQFQSKYPYASIESNDSSINFEYLLQHKNNISHILTELEFDSTDTYKFEVFSFTLTSSIQDFWNAKAYELAFVIAIFSGAWPYIKLLLLLVIWYMHFIQILIFNE